jgi:hypothetical protein
MPMSQACKFRARPRARHKRGEPIRRDGSPSVLRIIWVTRGHQLAAHIPESPLPRCCVREELQKPCADVIGVRIHSEA